MLNLHLDPNINYFVTSDQHIGHKNIITFCGRPFVNPKEMYNKIIENYNSVVKKGDKVFMLGDILWSESKTEFNKFMNKLNGDKLIIPGNHDREKALRDLPPDCQLLSDIVHIYLNNKPIFVLSHYPLVSWAGIERGCINIHGHIHSGPFSNKGFDTSFKSPNHIDAGVDNQNFYPLKIYEKSEFNKGTSE